MVVLNIDPMALDLSHLFSGWLIGSFETEAYYVALGWP